MLYHLYYIHQFIYFQTLLCIHHACIRYTFYINSISLYFSDPGLVVPSDQLYPREAGGHSSIKSNPATLADLTRESDFVI